MGMLTFLYEAESLSVSFNPALAKMVRPQTTPIQRLHVAESAHSYVYQIHTNEETILNIDFEDIPEEDQAIPESSGYNSLSFFIQNTLNWSEKTFKFTDPDGDEYNVRYWGGFDNIQEAAGRTQKKGRWSGTIVLRIVPV